LFWHNKIPPLFFWLFSNLGIGIAGNAIVGVFQVINPLPWRFAFRNIGFPDSVMTEDRNLHFSQSIAYPNESLPDTLASI